MATGTVNSLAAAAAQRVAAQRPPQPPAGPVIRAGEQTSSTIEAVADPNSRRYLTNVPGSQFIMPDGLALKFTGGVYVTNKADEIAELDKVANRVGSIITTTVQAKVAEAQLQQLAAQGAQTDNDGKPVTDGPDKPVQAGSSPATNP